MWMWQDLSSYHVYGFLAGPMLFAPFNWKNWYTITINVICLLFSYVPRYIYRNFHLSRPNVKLVNYIIACMTYMFDILCFYELWVTLMNFLPSNTISGIVLNSQFNTILTLTPVIVSLTIILLTIAVSVSRVLLLLYTFWFTSQDQKQLAVQVITSIIASSIGISLTGYRLVTRDYSDSVLYKLYLDSLGLGGDLKLKTKTNYPEFVILIPIALLLHIFSTSLEWKMTVYDTVNNGVQPAGVVPASPRVHEAHAVEVVPEAQSVRVVQEFPAVDIVPEIHADPPVEAVPGIVPLLIVQA